MVVCTVGCVTWIPRIYPMISEAIADSQQKGIRIKQNECETGGGGELNPRPGACDESRVCFEEGSFGLGPSNCKASSPQVGMVRDGWIAAARKPIAAKGRKEPRVRNNRIRSGEDDPMARAGQVTFHKDMNDTLTKEPEGKSHPLSEFIIDNHG
jgi:coenzyme F420-reducing hydrogenase gamma subunit